MIMQSPLTKNEPEILQILSQASTSLAGLPDALAVTDKEVHPAFADEYPGPMCKRSSHQYSSRCGQDPEEASSFREPM